MKRSIQATLALISVIAAAALAAPPTDEAVTRAVGIFAEKSKSLDRNDRENFTRLQAEAARAALEGIELSGLSVAQIRQLHKVNVLSYADVKDQVGARLDALAKGKDKDGAMAAVTRLYYLPSASVRPQGATDADRERAAQARKVHEAALQQIASHPGLPEAVAGGAEIFMEIGRVDRQVLASSGPQIMQIASLISSSLPTEAAVQLANFYDALSLAEGIQAADRERIRTGIAEVLRGTQGKVDDEKISYRVSNSLQYLEGAYLRGQLVGHASPPLDFTWTNYAGELKSIADLKGKVVVLDFWATWCGPCIGSFPNVRELTSHYKDYPVVFLGVTSLQGYHIDRPGGDGGATKRIDTKDAPDREYELMKTFVQQLDMTWPVAFSKQDVFNPDYGVRGIPHMAILDPEGVVRYRGVRSRGEKVEKTEKIDGLLREFSLPVPPPAAPIASGT